MTAEKKTNLNCPKCKSDKGTKVQDSRPMDERVFRRRVCKACGFRFNTYETYADRDSQIDLRESLKEAAKLAKSFRSMVQEKAQEIKNFA